MLSDALNGARINILTRQATNDVLFVAKHTNGEVKEFVADPYDIRQDVHAVFDKALVALQQKVTVEEVEAEREKGAY